MSAVGPTPLFVSGMLVAGYAVATLFFLKFWRQTRDRLFAWFSAAFALLLLQRLAITLARDLPIDPEWYYLLRLLGFVLILVAIIGKNRRAAG